MAAAITLEDELERLMEIFNEKHERFQILKPNSSAIICSFQGRNERHEIIIEVSERYPLESPLWTTETVERSVRTAVRNLHTPIEIVDRLTNQVNAFLKEICAFQNLPKPSGLEKLILFDKQAPPPAATSEVPTTSKQIIKKEDNSNQKGNFKGLSFFKKIHQTLTQSKASRQASTRATKRLMQELNKITRSKEYIEKLYSIEQVDDSIFEWNVYINQVDKDSSLHKDLMKLKESGGQSHIKLNMTFKETYPFDPPFVRVVYPVLTRGYVLTGGAICMELLSKNAWSAAYTIEAVIIQISATLVKGHARVNFKETNNDEKSPYNMESAQRTFKYLMALHERTGWRTPSKNEG